MLKVLISAAVLCLSLAVAHGSGFLPSSMGRSPASSSQVLRDDDIVRFRWDTIETGKFMENVSVFVQMNVCAQENGSKDLVCDKVLASKPRRADSLEAQNISVGVISPPIAASEFNSRAQKTSQGMRNPSFKLSFILYSVQGSAQPVAIGRTDRVFPDINQVPTNKDGDLTMKDIRIGELPLLITMTLNVRRNLK